MLQAPAIILSAPQMHENIGAAARAMANFSLSRLCLIAPRDGPPSEKAYAMASRADHILDDAVIHGDFAGAISDFQFIIATSARNRDIDKPVYSPAEAIKCLKERTENGENCGMLFGGERAGLPNSEIIHADILVHIPTNPDFSSLNLAQSVLLMAYEWFIQNLAQADDQGNKKPLGKNNAASKAASKKDIFHFHEHLISALDAKGFFYPTEKKPSMVQTLINLFTKAEMNEQEVRTLRGVIRALTKGF